MNNAGKRTRKCKTVIHGYERLSIAGWFNEISHYSGPFSLGLGVVVGRQVILWLRR